MRIAKIAGLTVAAIILLLLTAFGALWIFNPFAPAIIVSDPEPHGYRIQSDDFIANFYPAEHSDKAPAILLLGGSEGGMGPSVTQMALALRQENYAVMTLSYFGGPEQIDILEHVPLEGFDLAIEWLKSRSDVDKDRLGVMGVSKGAEAALIVATRHPELRAVIAGMPSSVVWQGINPNLLKQIFIPPDGSWSLGGEVVTYLPYIDEYVSGPMPFELYAKSLERLPDHPDAVIPVETIDATVLLICGEADTLWPSCDMARQIEERAEERQGPQINLLAFEAAGHAGFGIPLDPDHSKFDQLASIGGTAEGNNAARRDGWEALLLYLETAF